MTQHDSDIRQLYARRPRSLFLKLNAIGLLGIFVAAWWYLGLGESDWLDSRRIDNLQRFIGEITPYPLREQPGNWHALLGWLTTLWNERGFEATKATFSISVVAVILAGIGGLTVALPGARTVSTPEPFLQSGRRVGTLPRWTWGILVGAIRVILIIARAIPEYIWAFLLVAMLGPSAWPAILALAIHNFGILGKLGAEVVENVEPSTPRALRGMGMSRSQIGAVALLPMTLSKWLLFFFYRWECCIREATVLGMLGITSLGFWVTESRARDWYDEMVLFVMLGAVLVLVVDLISALTRRIIRRA